MPMTMKPQATTRAVLEDESGSFEVIELDDEGHVLAVLQSHLTEREALRTVREAPTS